MAVIVGEVTTEPAAQKSRAAESDAGGGGAGGDQPSEHDIEKMMAMQAERYERVRAY